MLAIQILDYPFNITPAKIALLLFYVRIFTIRRFQICAYIVGFMVLAVGLATFIDAFFECYALMIFKNTRYEAWNHGITSMRTILSVNSLTGLLILILPIPSVWKLHAPRGQKMVLTGIFLLSGMWVIHQ
jgi:beta-lactamase regulating signal transducer with metallopeptidase domain